ncbi:hypothetical protein OIU74_006045 [Salix koriyanagi]|uniref:Uncharacterized protein n=1 Tax=Salix koriyanagi TaxID=2511006 RepID=A0A9Q0UDD9_9ROSI|nr:hypothetical protein OIU74_006045 [Salix koriyanagi]
MNTVTMSPSNLQNPELFTLDKEHEVVKNSSENTQYKARWHNLKAICPSTTSLHPGSLLQPSRNSMHKSSAIATSSFVDIQNPVQIATRGTVGSLVMQELKYFSQVESSHGSSQKSQPHVTVMASTSNQSKTIPGSALSTTKKKLRGGSRRLPRICSVVEVSDCSRPIGNSGI